MTRTLGMGLLGLALLAGPAAANGFGNGGGYAAQVGTGVNFNFGLSPISPGCGDGGGGGGGGGVRPYQLGPWYQYWPYEAHFQTPAMPMYPYWGAHTLPNGSPVINPGYPGHGAVPQYWQGGR